MSPPVKEPPLKVSKREVSKMLPRGADDEAVVVDSSDDTPTQTRDRPVIDP